jgi:hypothetical protein
MENKVLRRSFLKTIAAPVVGISLFGLGYWVMDNTNERRKRKLETSALLQPLREMQDSGIELVLDKEIEGRFSFKLFQKEQTIFS